MNKKLLGLLAVLVLGLISFFLLFGGIGGFTSWYKTKTNDKAWVPFSNYKNRVVDSSKIVLLDSTHVVLEDESMFWKGQGATVIPKFNDAGELEQLEITSGGSGYGAKVTARISGAGASQFELGEVTVQKGKVIAIKIKEIGKWYVSPRTFLAGDKLPYSGTVEIKHRNGQIFERRQYLSGELHGKWSKWKSNGIPIFDKEYIRGMKHGTHMYWYGEPIDPKDYKSVNAKAKNNEKTYVSLWVEVNQKVKEKFKGKSPTQQEWNEWVVKTFQEKGGSFGPELLEHYDNNKRQGLFEKYDDSGNKIFKDEYEYGRLIKHKAFDPGKSS